VQELKNRNLIFKEKKGAKKLVYKAQNITFFIARRIHCAHLSLLIHIESDIPNEFNS